MADDLPYLAEYAKSGRASCKGCKGNIAKDSLRLAAMVQSPMFDGKVPNWYHYMCFFGKQRPKTVADIAHFDSLRWDDQEKIKSKVEAGGGGEAVPAGKNGKGRKGKKKEGASMDYVMEYAKSGRAMCRGCETKIAKDEIRVSKKDYDSDSAKRYGPVDMWHHLDCFVKKRAELEFFASGDTISGYGTLSADDKKLVKEKLKSVEVKRKSEDEPDQPAKKIKTEEEEKVKKQNKIMFKNRDMLKSLKKKELAYLIEYNNQYIPTGESVMLDRLSDMMTFGKLERCSVCKDGCFVYQSGVGYTCKGDLTEWTKCTNVTKEPKRSAFKIPKELAEGYQFLGSYKYKDIGARIIIDRGPSTAEIEAKKENGTAAMSSSKPLEGMKFVITGKNFKRDKKKLTELIKELGGDVGSTVSKTTAAVITTSDEIAACSKKIDAAKEHNIQCVSEDFVDEVGKGGALLMIQKKNLVPWGGDPQDRVHSGVKKSGSLESRFTKSVPDKLKVKLKGGASVDPDSGLEDCAHVYQRGSKYYNCVLGMVDIVKGTNSYYKLQVLEADTKRDWYVFRAWGRVGTTVGGNKLEQMEDLNDAIRHFEGLYEEKTGNRFTAKEFNKLPNHWYPLDIDYGGEEEKFAKPQVAGSKSKLDKAIQELVALIFDVDTMKNTMVEYEIDLKKMPLGKLSKKQIERAYLVLTDTLDVLKKVKDNPDSGPGAKAQLIDCSNRFYTLIPHDFGMKKPPILDSEDLINAKIGMLDSLSEIELAYNILKSEDDEEDKNADPIDKHFKKLKTKMDVIDKTSDEFSMIKKYVKNTHAETHDMYNLELEEVFKIERQGEKKRFKPFKQLHNRQLLWHGSRLTNFAGILSQGLRIAPPEAPVTGYMFGKGIYFADMVSKSANYCRTSRGNPTGLLMLCEVALGNMYERLRADYIEKLPSGKHSTKGMGQTHPDPNKTLIVEDGLQIPLGKGVPADVKNSSLLYNEYIVYDVAQVKAKYLLKVNFDYK